MNQRQFLEEVEQFSGLFRCVIDGIGVNLNTFEQDEKTAEDIMDALIALSNHLYGIIGRAKEE